MPAPPMLAWASLEGLVAPLSHANRSWIFPRRRRPCWRGPSRKSLLHRQATPTGARFSRDEAVAEELIRQLFLEIPVHFGAFRHDDESVGVDAAHQAQQPLDFVLGNHGHQDVGILFRVGTSAGPVGNAALHLGENYVGDSRVLGENHHLHVDVLDEHPVQEHRQNRGVDQGIDDHFHIKDEEADTVDKNIHDDADNSDFGIGMANGHAHADDILPAAGGTSAHYHSGTASGDDAAHKAGRQGIVHDRCGRHGNQCQRQRGNADGHQGFKAEFFSHHLIGDEEQRHVLQEVDDTHQVKAGRHRNVQHVDAEEAQ